VVPGGTSLVQVTPVIGTKVGQYRILEQIGSGGMGRIYRGEHALIGRNVAIKFLHPALCLDPEAVERFFAEARLVGALRHPGIVEVFDMGMSDAGGYIVMELLQGVPLAKRLAECGAMTATEAALYLRGVCSALTAAHARGIVHRDLKPDNVFLVADPESPIGERAKLLDFGIAKQMLANLTQTGAVFGTPAYMAPEQCRGQHVDHRADLYAVGCMMYEMLSGRPPFLGSFGELVGAHQFMQPEPLSRYTRVTDDVEELVMQLLAKDPDHRIQSARELAERLTCAAQRMTPMTLGTPYDLSRPFGDTVSLVGPVSPCVDRSPPHDRVTVRAPTVDPIERPIPKPIRAVPKIVVRAPSAPAPVAEDAVASPPATPAATTTARTRPRPARASNRGLSAAVACVVIAGVLAFLPSSETVLRTPDALATRTPVSARSRSLVVPAPTTAVLDAAASDAAPVTALIAAPSVAVPAPMRLAPARPTRRARTPRRPAPVVDPLPIEEPAQSPQLLELEL
jgi:serine/threonine protein kinase